MKGIDQNRRSFLHRIVVAAAWSGFAFTLAPLTGCGGGGDGSGAGGSGSGGEDGKTPGASNPGGNVSADATKAAADPCADVSGLTPEEVTDRRDTGYLAETPDPEKRCDNCQLWEPPQEGSPCGGCTVLAGPIHAGGYCDLWVQV